MGPAFSSLWVGTLSAAHCTPAEGAHAARAQLYLFPIRDLKLVMVGLDNAGKTTVRARARVRAAPWCAAVQSSQWLNQLQRAGAVQAAPGGGRHHDAHHRQQRGADTVPQPDLRRAPAPTRPSLRTL